MLAGWDDEAPAWAIEAAREIRDRLIDLSARHEREEHDGEPCVENRVGLAAYFMHVLGLGVEHLPLVRDVIEEYDARHAAHQHSNGHGPEAES